MPEDTFRIRIKPDGTIHFATRDLGEERLRLLRDMIEECLGPVQEVRIGDPDGAAGSGVKIVEGEKQEELRHKR